MNIEHWTRSSTDNYNDNGNDDDDATMMMMMIHIDTVIKTGGVLNFELWVLRETQFVNLSFTLEHDAKYMVHVFHLFVLICDMTELRNAWKYGYALCLVFGMSFEWVYKHEKYDFSWIQHVRRRHSCHVCSVYGVRCKVAGGWWMVNACGFTFRVSSLSVSCLLCLEFALDFGFIPFRLISQIWRMDYETLVFGISYVKTQNVTAKKKSNPIQYPIQAGNQTKPRNQKSE